jgi:dienelactone hydrolase
VRVAGYDPFLSGASAVGMRTLRLADPARKRELPCVVWYPLAGEAGPGAELFVDRRPLVVFSHLSGGRGTSSSFVCAHLASHGYVVAAPDHSEVVVPDLAGTDGETGDARAARVEAIIASRVPDVRLVLDRLVGAGVDEDVGTALDVELDDTRVGVVGHSFGGWTALATPDVEPRVTAVVALAPGGSSRARPGILPLRLAFTWDRSVPTLVLAGDRDVMTPLDGIAELFARIPTKTKRMYVLRCADHLHFVDDVTGAHESLRRSTLPGEAAWIPAAMRPLAELCSPESAHAFVCGLALAHLDAFLRGRPPARAFLGGGVTAALRRHGIDAYGVCGPASSETS